MLDIIIMGEMLVEIMREKEEAARIHEENRIADLKAYCEKKGLDFETENAKALKKLEKKKKK